MKFLTLLIGLVFLSSCSASNQKSDEESQQALTLVKKVCDGENELSWAERAKLAAQANFLDNRWERLADATYIQAGVDEITKVTKILKYTDYPEPALFKYYESRIQFAKVSAECSILELLDNKEN